MQAIQLPHPTMEGMRPMFVHRAVRGTPPHFVGNAMGTGVQSVLSHSVVGIKLVFFFLTRHMSHVFRRSSPPGVAFRIPPQEGGCPQ